MMKRRIAIALAIFTSWACVGTLRFPAFGEDDAPATAEASAEPDSELLRMVLDLVGDKDKDLRALGFEQVRTEVKGPAATREIAAQLRKLAPEAQIGLLGALADRGDPAAMGEVFLLLETSRDETVRAAAIAVIGVLGNVAHLGTLLQRLSATSEAERDAARQSLVRLRGDDVSAQIALCMELTDYRAAARVQMIEILAERRAQGEVPQILPKALNEDPAVRAAAIKALGALASAEHLPGLVQVVLHAAPGADRESAEKCVAQVCSRVADAENRAKPLLAAIEVLSPDKQVLLLPTLGRVGGVAALPIIEAALTDSDAQRREAGLRAICNWPDAAVAPRLLELAQNASQSDEARALALAALVRVAPLPDKRPDSERLALVKQVMALCTRDADREQVIKRVRAIRTIETLRFLVPYMDQPRFAQQACESLVELAHHRGLREPNKEEFDRVLDRVIATSQDAAVVERAGRYKKGQTWVRPK
ncbi:MAG: HEAT repeat domain-containing protein [Pirellulales bacterium]|nr:HEAT repeat domain-containing protein [Pirellulales bacterium]